MGHEFPLFAISVLILGVSIALAFVPVIPSSLRVLAGIVALLSLAFLVMLLYIKERNATMRRILREHTGREGGVEEK
jgi:hypothetical protein